jgi:hypothetical protein
MNSMVFFNLTKKKLKRVLLTVHPDMHLYISSGGHIAISH